MNNEQIKKILDDLYLIDPELKKYEKDLAEMIKKILESRPNTKFDEKFAQRLKKEIMEKIKKMKNQEEKNARLFFNFNFMKKFSYAPAGIIILLLIIAPAAFYLTKKNIDLAYNTLKISALKEGAFGSLAAQDQTASTQADARSEGGGGGEMIFGRGGGGGMGAASDIGFPAPEIVNYNYIYKGEEINISGENGKMEVYRRKKSQEGVYQLAKNVLGKINFDSVDLKKFNNTKITNFSLAEERDFGYMVNFDLEKNMVSIFSNWNKWPRPDSHCRDQACFDQHRLKINDMLSDEEIIKIAEDFVKEYKVNLDNYGPGQVFDYWRYYYETAGDKENVYIPESVSVIYPLKLNGKTLHDGSGFPSGLSVEINIRYKKASGLIGMTLQNYEAAAYEIEADSQKIINLAEQGGFYAGYRNLNPTKVIDVELGTPALGLMSHWKYDQGKTEGEELFVPALIFPIEKTSEETPYLFRKNIAIPLVKEILEERENNDYLIGIPEIKQ
ncbi:MAG: hypothetical protein PHQ42_01010 [Patescibacteria group bacterium]|nr:hypothetical protein [Patescibacteria group bacterium]